MRALGSAWKLAAEAFFLLSRGADWFSRELSPREIKSRFARNAAPHFPDRHGRCVVCGRRETRCDLRALCPGTIAQQVARQELRAGDEELHC